MRIFANQASAAMDAINPEAFTSGKVPRWTQATRLAIIDNNPEYNGDYNHARGAEVTKSAVRGMDEAH